MCVSVTFCRILSESKVDEQQGSMVTLSLQAGASLKQPANSCFDLILAPGDINAINFEYRWDLFSGVGGVSQERGSGSRTF